MTRNSTRNRILFASLSTCLFALPLVSANAQNSRWDLLRDIILLATDDHDARRAPPRGGVHFGDHHDRPIDLRSNDIQRQNPHRFTDSRLQIRRRPVSRGIGLDMMAHIERRGDVFCTSTSDAPVWIGTKKQSRSIEGLRFDLCGLPPHELEYMAHISGKGDTCFVPGGTYVGTKHQSRAIEGVALQLCGQSAKHFDILYRGHISGLGNTCWYKNGEFCGTRKQSRPLEALQVMIVPKQPLAYPAMRGQSPNRGWRF